MFLISENNYIEDAGGDGIVTMCIVVLQLFKEMFLMEQEGK